MIEYIRPILDRPFFYELHNTLIGAKHRSRILVRDYVHPEPTDRILDIGCGPGNMVPYLSDCSYVGVDMNEDYIERARARFGKQAEFSCRRVSEHTVQEMGAFDIVLALGLLHHLDDAEADDLFRLGYAALKPGGRMITMDGCYLPSQSKVERYLLDSDRGRFVRSEEDYLKLAHARFSQINRHLRPALLRIPYTHLFLECIR
jgi:cyclopropane fatty-acyl-phospholipid synthase-like methyltransferase